MLKKINISISIINDEKISLNYVGKVPSLSNFSNINLERWNQYNEYYKSLKVNNGI